MHWRAMMEPPRERRCRHRRWLAIVSALLALLGGMTGFFSVGGCEPVTDWLRDSLPRTARDT